VSMTNSSDRVEIITSVQRRRRWTAPEKVRMVEETFEPGMTGSATSGEISVDWRPSPAPRVETGTSGASQTSLDGGRCDPR
jgi:Transposase